MDSDSEPGRSFAAVDARLHRLERALGTPAQPPLAALVEECIDATAQLVRALLAADARKPPVAADADLLALFKALAKGEPSWTAIRDNCRELIYYRSCLALGRADALPAAPARMAVRTARHLHLYLRSRCETAATR